jgi:hemerythrin
MAIEWYVQMEIDDGLIDADHRNLIDLVNSVDPVRPGAAMRREIATILDRLSVHARVHFQREEQLQAAIHYVNASAHERHHECAVCELATLRAGCDRKMDQEESTAFQRHVSALLNEWLVDHIVRSDGLMKPFASELRAHSLGAVSLAEAVQLHEAGLHGRQKPTVRPAEWQNVVPVSSSL